MPLIKSASKKAFEKNFATELAALKRKGKSGEKARKQALAIAFETQRRSKRKSS